MGLLGFPLRVEMLLRVTLKRWKRQSCGAHISYWENQAETFQLLIYQILDTGRKVAAESICQQATADYFLFLYLGNHFTKELKK